MHDTIRSEAALFLHYADETPYGSGVSGMLDALLKRSCAPLLRAFASRGFAEVQTDSAAWNRRIMAPQALGALYESPSRIREACVYPPRQQVRPVAISAGVGGRTQRISLGADAATLAPQLTSWAIGERSASRSALYDRLREVGAIGPRSCAEPIPDGVTFLGHAALAVQAEGTRILFDPFLPPGDASGPALLERAARPDAVFVTHSHPDHFDPIGLARLAGDARIFVPAVERESALATDMAYRLRELGFSRVTPLSAGSVVQVGPFRVVALPFRGEQPSDGAVLHPAARNEGLTYLCCGLGRRVAVIADAGQDSGGSTLEMAKSACALHGPVDMLFGGYRAWRMRPIRFLGSSVARYFLFVPASERDRIHKIMNDADDLVATGLAWGASQIVPYANGGTADYARIGLGPPLVGSGDADIDPDVEKVCAAAARRGVLSRIRRMSGGETVALFDATGKIT